VPRRSPAVLAWSRIALVAIALTACSRAVPGPYTPSITAVIETIEPAADGGWLFRLTSGATFEARPDQDGHFRQVYTPSSGLAVVDHGRDQLLLGGTDQAGDWFAIVPPAGRTDLPPDCFGLLAWGTDEGDSILTDVGLRLPKAADFDPEILPLTPGGFVPRPSPGMRYEATQQTFCLNTAGDVTIRDWGLWQATR
jgi:hypothetical protein